MVGCNDRYLMYSYLPRTHLVMMQIHHVVWNVSIDTHSMHCFVRQVLKRLHRNCRVYRLCLSLNQIHRVVHSAMISNLCRQKQQQHYHTVDTMVII